MGPTFIVVVQRRCTCPAIIVQLGGRIFNYFDTPQNDWMKKTTLNFAALSRARSVNMRIHHLYDTPSHANIASYFTEY